MRIVSRMGIQLTKMLRLRLDLWNGFNFIFWVAVLIGESLPAFSLQEGTINIQGTPISQAQEPISAKVFIGFDPELPSRREQTWVPITVEITNNQNEITGELLIRLKDGRETCRTPVTLPAKTKKSYSLLVHIPEQLDELEFYIQSGNKQIPFQTVTVAGEYGDTTCFIAVLSAERGTHEHFTNHPEEEVAVARHVLYTSPALLPRFWVGYQNIDILMWDGATPTGLTNEQIQALETWIQLGGTLVLASGERWQELNTSSLRLYVPITLTGSRVLAAGTRLQSLTEPIQPVLKSGLVMATGEMIKDPQIKVWLKADDNPFLVERKWGAGRIVWIASTLRVPLFDNSSQQKNLEDFLSAAPTRISDKYLSQLDSTLAASLRGLVQAELPSAWFIAGYLGCYIILVVPVNYLIFRRLRRLEWAWFTVPVWAVLFAYGAYYLGALRQQGKVSVSEISVLESQPGSPIASTLSYCSIYSPIRQWYSLHFENPFAFPQLPLLSDSGGGTRGTLDESLTVDFAENSLSVEDYLIYHWSQRLLKALHTTPIGKGLEIDLKYDGEKLSGILANHTNFTLHDPVIYFRERLLSLADLETGKQIQITPEMETNEFDVQMVLDEIQRYPYFQRNPRNLSTLIKETQRFYAAQQCDRLLPQGLAIFTAVIDQPQLNFTLNQKSADPQGKSLFSVIFPLHQELHGRVLLSSSSWKISDNVRRPISMRGMGMYGLPPRPGPRDFSDGRSLVLTSKSDYNWSMATEAPLKDGKIEELRISIRYPRIYYPSRNFWGRGAVQGGMIDPQGPPAVPMENGIPVDSRYWIQIKNVIKQSYEPLPSLLNSQGEVLHPERYVDKINGMIYLRLRGMESRFIALNSENVAIEAVVNYGDGTQSAFLGLPLVEISEAGNEGAQNDTH